MQHFLFFFSLYCGANGIRTGTRQSLILNDIVISTRNTDNYVNVTELCKAGGKLFKHWNENSKSKAFLTELSRSAGIPADLLIHVIPEVLVKIEVLGVILRFLKIQILKV